ncbi:MULTISPECIES: TA system toxin CbtA family protein [unclassified Serratia (in: enterobacteria)]|uniref:TA system toxin CbtA family protein n=1 Tax=unclassified Serratia (in: enterobacteria) TaxID=2647522 RepID=UPI002ED26FD1|nr:TA system toxin CbtA family protein [Serratia sp. C2(2)]MEE4448123.1 TA system toxin CbtA family protein [Serratia sp. C2(1)]
MTIEQCYWQTIAGRLLAKYFGLTLNDTDLCEAECVMALQEVGVRPFEAINNLVDKYHLVRLGTHPFTPPSPFLRQEEELGVIGETEQEITDD